jgi:hypothetical protein
MNIRSLSKVLVHNQKRILFPGGRQLTRGLVVTSKTVNTRLDKNQTILGVLVLSVTFQVLTDGDSLLDKMVQVFGNFGSETAGLQDTEDLVTSDGSNLRNTIRVTKDDTNLRGSKTLLGILADHVNNFFRSSLDPRRRSTAIREGTARDTLTRSVHTTHID